MKEYLIENFLCSCNSSYEIKNDRLVCINSSCNSSVAIVDNIPRFHSTPLDPAIDYDVSAYRNKKNWSDWRLKNYDYFNSQLSSFDETKKVLDIGSGTNTFFDLFNKFEYFSCDYKPFSNQDFCIDINKKIPLQDNTFDLVILSNVLEHTYDFNNLIFEINRILKINGSVIITVPFIIKLHQQPYDYYRFTEFALNKILSENNFTNIKIEAIGSYIDNYKFFHHVFKSEMYKANQNILSRLVIKIVYQIYYIIFLALEKCFIDKEIYFKKDYPQGYGCRAEK